MGMSALKFEQSEDASFLVIAILAALARNCSLEVFSLYPLGFCPLQVL